MELPILGKKFFFLDFSLRMKVPGVAVDKMVYRAVKPDCTDCKFVLEPLIQVILLDDGQSKHLKGKSREHFRR